MIVDMFGGPGGWAEGLRLLDLDEIGVELDPWACATRRAARHRVIRADVARFPLDHLAGRVEGLIASPPCQAFSLAGKGEGRLLIHDLVVDIHAGRWDAPYPELVRPVLEVGRWVETLGPRWVACEQVPTVLPLWQMYAHRFRGAGYYAWAGVLQAADYGVPQTRERAFLIASLDHPVGPPSPTHCDEGGATLFGRLEPWVAMVDAIGWGLPAEPAPVVMTARNRQTGHDALNGSSWRREWFTRQQAAGNWVVRTGNNSMVTGRTGSRAGDGDVAACERLIDRPSPTLDTKTGHWTLHRPATTVAGDPRLSGPGRNDPTVPGSQYGPNSVHLTLPEALILQSFRPDYPVQGTKTQQFKQVGNAVPPLLAAHIIAAVTGRTMAAAA